MVLQILNSKSSQAVPMRQLSELAQICSEPTLHTVVYRQPLEDARCQIYDDEREEIVTYVSTCGSKTVK